MRRHYPGGVAAAIVRYFAFLLAIGFVDSVDVSTGARLVLLVFGAFLPLSVIGWSATRAANFVDERRARRLLRPGPGATYLFLALGWALTAGACGLLALAAGARSTGPGVGEDWIATGLVWAAMISACGTLLMIGRALSARTAPWPRWLARRRGAWLENSPGPLAHPVAYQGVTGGATASRSVVDRDRALALADLGRCLELLLRRREQESPDSIFPLSPNLQPELRRALV
jgi:hypothetical protein